MSCRLLRSPASISVWVTLPCSRRVSSAKVMFCKEVGSPICSPLNISLIPVVVSFPLALSMSKSATSLSTAGRVLASMA
ncbi:hypothetical protein D3C81_2036180 [compost metagenome]